MMLIPVHPHCVQGKHLMRNNPYIVYFLILYTVCVNAAGMCNSEVCFPKHRNVYLPHTSFTASLVPEPQFVIFLIFFLRLTNNVMDTCLRMNFQASPWRETTRGMHCILGLAWASLMFQLYQLVVLGGSTFKVTVFIKGIWNNQICDTKAAC